jgi:NAD(P)-dependent dehydrogenase (short-subunit alcohol dehydrogenase family)
LYWALQNTWTYPNAQTYVTRLLAEVPAAKEPLNKQLAVITNITVNGSSYHVAEELALSLGMHLVLLSSKKLSKLKHVEESLQRDARQRGIDSNQNYCKPIVYKIHYDDNSLASVVQAAQEVMQIATLGSSDGKYCYNGQIPMLIHNPSGVTVAYGTTEDGIEVNVGRNFVASHVLTEQLLPCLKQAATEAHRPRIVYVSSVGHCQGTDFDPLRFLQLPDEGGAPDGTLQQTLVTSDETTDTHVGTKVYVENEELDGPVVMYYRSKMAVIADAMALALEEPSLAPVSAYPGSVASSKKKGLGIAESIYQTGFYMFNLSPKQAARSTLRAALDPIFNDSSKSEFRGAYLHCDGNAWTVADPVAEHPDTLAPYSLKDYVVKVRECTKQLCASILSRLEETSAAGTMIEDKNDTPGATDQKKTEPTQLPQQTKLGDYSDTLDDTAPEETEPTQLPQRTEP